MENNSNNKLLPVLFIIAIVLVAGGVVFAVTNRSTKDAQPTGAQQVQPSVTTSTTASVTPMEGQTAAKTVTVVASNFAFAPNTITVKKGDTVKVLFKNDQGVHDFVIDELNVKTEVLSGGKSQEVTFVADKAGTFEYYCSVGNHRQMGMVGKLVVE